MSGHLILLEEAEDISEEMLFELFRIDIAKASDPRTKTGFAASVAALFRGLRRRMTGDEKEAEKAASEDLDQDWANLKPKARTRAINRAASRIARLGVLIPPKLREVWRRHADRIVRATRRSIAATFAPGLSLGATSFDATLVDWIVGSQTNFVTNEYGRRVVAMSRRARRIVADGIRRGMFRDDLARRLSADTKLIVTGRSRWYYDVSSRIFINRGRTLSSLTSYQDAGFDKYQLSVVRDARTSNICRFMKDKMFTVSAGLKQFEDMSQLKNPDGVRDLAPFVIDGLDADGNEALIFNRNGRRRVLARVDRSGVGTPGDRGEFSGELSDEGLRRAGIIGPPFH